jgi:SAM-dependent methyltransferase
MDYRTRIYDGYATIMQDAGTAFDFAAARKWGLAYKYYLRRWLPQAKDAAIADLACGGGALLFHFKEAGYTNLHGVDHSASQVLLARQVDPGVVEQSLFDFLRAHPGRFDLITGLDIIEHLTKDDWFDFLDLCYYSLRPGGRLVLQTPNADSPWGSALRYADFTHELSITPDCLSRLLKLCGFVQTEPRELGPVPFGYSMTSTCRCVLWFAIRALLTLWNRAETGASGSGIFTRVFIISARKP